MERLGAGARDGARLAAEQLDGHIAVCVLERSFHERLQC